MTKIKDLVPGETILIDGGTCQGPALGVLGWVLLLYSGYDQKYHEHCFKPLAADEVCPEIIVFDAESIHRMKVIPLLELPLYINSPYLSDEFGNLLKKSEV